jgi:predicted protein tyrosine phosphatase
MKVLFVCTLNKARSIAAERLYRRTPGVSVRSAGISERAAHPLETADLSWADLVIVFEPAHEAWIRRHFSGELPTITDVGITDGLGVANPRLLAALREVLTPILGAPGGTSADPAPDGPARR